MMADPGPFPLSVLRAPRKQRQWRRYEFEDGTRVSVLDYSSDSNARLWVRRQLAEHHGIGLRDVPAIVAVVGNIGKPDPPQNQMAIDELVGEDDGQAL